MRTAVSFILVGLLLQLCLHSGLGQIYSSNKRLTHSKQQQQNFTTSSALISKTGEREQKKKAIHSRKSGGYAFLIGIVDLPHPRSRTK